MSAAVGLGRSTHSDSSADSRTVARVTAPRKLLAVTIAVPDRSGTAIRSSGRSSAWTGPRGRGSPACGSRAPSTSTSPDPVACAGTRFIVPTNSATNAVAGRV
ncbi:MAG TPA: hypothetical protein VHW92_01675 [Mycobacteriales bacterium]|nr:hypothetical protein [Mycobacteriales bacterium]